jgi:hypothetical protein
MWFEVDPASSPGLKFQGHSNPNIITAIISQARAEKYLQISSIRPSCLPSTLQTLKEYQKSPLGYSYWHDYGSHQNLVSLTQVCCMRLDM